MTQETFRAFIDRRFTGVLLAGSHRADGEACVLEALSAYQGQTWSDDPTAVGCWDLRPLNDIDVAPEVRLEWMVRLAEAYAGAPSWPVELQCAVAERLVILTVQRLVSTLPGLPQILRDACRDASTAEAAEAAAGAAAGAAGAAAGAAEAAEKSVSVFVTACTLWIEAAEQVVRIF